MFWLVYKAGLVVGLLVLQGVPATAPSLESLFECSYGSYWADGLALRLLAFGLLNLYCVAYGYSSWLFRLG